MGRRLYSRQPNHEANVNVVQNINMVKQYIQQKYITSKQLLLVHFWLCQDEVCKKDSLCTALQSNLMVA